MKFPIRTVPAWVRRQNPLILEPALYPAVRRTYIGWYGNNAEFALKINSSSRCPLRSPLPASHIQQHVLTEVRVIRTDTPSNRATSSRAVMTPDNRRHPSRGSL